MQQRPSSLLTAYQAVMMALGWFALLAQFYINATLKATPLPEMIIRYFSYFTIQTNLLVATAFTCLLLAPRSRAGRFFSRQQTMTAITVYILIVGLIYNTILRFLWAPQGLQKTVDELLHTVIPLLALAYWLFFLKKDQLQWKDVLPWLIYPFAYISYVLIRGSISGFYPYPFINTAQLGLNKVLVNSVGIALVFVFASLVLVFIAKNLRGTAS
ncbi:MAG TPA: Pr6Pr family membrane protein [Chitinophagaceae bacterium]|nr:Pr6Pr family membrane protein [Chitinophagaceae bacterium]